MNIPKGLPFIFAWFCLCLAASPAKAAAPPNDAFEAAVLIEGTAAGTDAWVSGSTEDATPETDEPAHGGLAATRSIWWRWTSIGYASASVDAGSSAFAPVVAVYTGHGLVTLQPVEGRYTGPAANPRSLFTFMAEPGVDYWVAVDVVTGVPGVAGLHITASPFTPLAPTISTQPKGTIVALGARPSVKVSAAGRPAPTYQWYRDNVIVTRGTNSQLDFVNIQPSEAGSYVVVISNAFGVARSDPALLQVVVTPLVTVQPVSKVVLPNSEATFTVSASAPGAIGYQWFHEGIPIVGAISNVLTVRNVQSMDQGRYHAQLASFFGTVLSSEATLTLSRPATSAESQPQIVTLTMGGSSTVQEGLTTKFEAKVTGGKPMTAQWYQDGNLLPGATNLILQVLGKPGAAGVYSITISNAFGTASRSLSPLSVTPVPRPANDLFANRSLLNAVPFAVGSTLNATGEPGEISARGSDEIRSIWWSYRGFTNGMVTVDTAGSATFAILSVFTGNTLPELTLVTRQVSISGNGMTKATFHAYPGEEFQIAVEDYYSSYRGEVRLTTSVVPDPPLDEAPAITNSLPDAINLDAGQALDLQVLATGAYPLAYEWRRGNQVLTNAMGPRFVITNAQAADSGDFRVVVLNANGRVEAGPCRVTVREAPPAIQGLTQPMVVTAGSPITLNPQVSGTTPLGFQWHLDGQPLDGETRRLLSWTAVKPGPAGMLTFTASNSVASTVWTQASITVVAPGTRYRWSTLAGTPRTQGTNDGHASEARFSYPSGLALDPDGIVHVADLDSGLVRRVTPDGTVSTFQRTGGIALKFAAPTDLAFGQNGSLVVIGSTLSCVYPGGLVGTFGTGDWGVATGPDGSVWRTTGPGVERILPDGTRRTMATGLNTVVDIEVDANGVAYLAEAGGWTIRRLAPEGQLSLVAGVPSRSGTADGPATAALFLHPNSVSVDAAGFLFVADEFANTIRRISPDGIVTTVGGRAGVTGSADGVGPDARFSSPRRVVVAPDGTLYVADTANHTIRKGTPVTASAPAIQTTLVDDEVTLTWTPGDGLFWLECSEQVGPGAIWKELDRLANRLPSGWKERTAGGGSRFYRLNGP